MSARREWPVARHFDPSRVDQIWRVPYEQRAREARAFAEANAVPLASGDEKRVGLLLIDAQNTFCQPDFELFVAGRSGRAAVLDNTRLCDFLYRNLGSITQVVATLDTHTAMQIFHAVFWVDDRGQNPPPFTVVSREDVERGTWRVNPQIARVLGGETAFDVSAHARHYAATLRKGGKYPLTIWPYHAMLGGIGHALVSAVEEALFFHAIARSSPVRFETKGSHPLTEHYSILRPEVLTDHAGARVGEPNRTLIDYLLGFDAILVAGQAKSHCVAWTVADLLSEIQARDPGLARRVHLLEDCTSPVVVSGVVDYTDTADEAFARFADAGAHLVRSTDPLEGWLHV